MIRLNTLEKYASEFERVLMEGCDNEPIFFATHLSALAYDRSCLLAAIRRELEIIARGDREQSGIQSEDVVLHASENFTLSVSTLDHTQSADLCSSVGFVFAVNLTNHEMAYDSYQLPSDWREDVFVQGTQLTYLGRRTVEVGGVTAFDCLKKVFQVQIPERTTILKLVVPKDVGQIWTFDPHTLKATGTAAVRFQDTSKVHIAEMLEQIGSSASIGPLIDLAKSHPRHFVRWAAMKALAGIDAHAAQPVVALARHDNNPDVRASAERATRIIANVLA